MRYRARSPARARSLQCGHHHTKGEHHELSDCLRCMGCGTGICGRKCIEDSRSDLSQENGVQKQRPYLEEQNLLLATRISHY